MKAIYFLPLMVSAAILVVLSVPVAASKMDDNIESSAKNSYVFKTYLKDDAVKAQSKDGVVTLTGSVSDESHKELAELTVANLPEVKQVDNQLEVKGDHPSEMSDAWLLTKVKTTLLFHRSVSATTDVDVKDGIVTLRGAADNQAQKDLTTEYAKDVEGVKDVNNEMTLAKTPAKTLEKTTAKITDKIAEKTRTVGDKVDDASITALVKMTLLYHRSTSGLKTSVTTKNGVVALTGIASNQAEKDLASKFTSDVNGVQKVDNRMTIEK